MKNIQTENDEFKQRLRENWLVENQLLEVFIDRLRYYSADMGSRYSFIGSVGTIHRSIAGYEYYLEHNLDVFKQHMHVSALSGLRKWAEPTHEHLSIWGAILDAIVSDNPWIVRELASFEHADLHAPRASSAQMETALLQSAILERDNVVAQLLERTAAKGNNADRKELERGHNFFDCLLKKDSKALVECIQRITRTPFAKNDPQFRHFMHQMATVQAKLCHLRGILVEIDHPLVPMDIVRVAPLADYDNAYDFLEPGFVPLKPTLKDRWRFFMRKRAQRKA